MKKVDSNILKETLTKVKDKIPTKVSELENDSEYINSDTEIVKPTLTSGTKVAEIQGKEIYAPGVTVTANYTSGTLIATINGVKIYMP